MICLITFFFVVSCESGSSKITEEIVGNYTFQFPSGEFELLKIEKNFSYSQKYYKNFSNFKKGIGPVHSNIGKWSKSNEYQIYFDNWLEYCYMSNPDSILPKPEFSDQANVSWYRASGNSKAKLSIYSESNYIFEKID